MPGTNLNLDLPSLSDTMSDMVAKTATALAAIQADLAPKVTSGEFQVVAALSMNGNALTNVTRLGMATGITPTAKGSIYIDSAGELHFIDNTADIRLTRNGVIDIGAVGTIVGDYGGTNPARVTYVDLSGQYIFTEDTGVYATLVADGMIIEGSAGTLAVSIGGGIVGNRNFIFSQLPTSGISLLAYDSGTGAVDDSAQTRVTNVVLATNTDITGNYRHTTKQMAFEPTLGDVKAQTGSPSATPLLPGVISISTTVYQVRLPPLQNHQRLTAVHVWQAASTGSGAATFKLQVMGNSGSGFGYVDVAGATVTTPVGQLQSTLAPTTPGTADSFTNANSPTQYSLNCSFPSSSGTSRIFQIVIDYDVVT